MNKQTILEEIQVYSARYQLARWHGRDALAKHYGAIVSQWAALLTKY